MNKCSTNRPNNPPPLTIIRFDCFVAPLLIPEDQVNPMVQVPRDMRRLQGVPQLLHELLRGVVCPCGKLHVVHWRPVRAVPVVDARGVAQKVPLCSSVVEFGSQLLKVRHVLQAVLVHLRDTVEHSVRVIESAVAQAQHQLRELAHQVEQHEAWRRVVAPVEEPEGRGGRLCLTSRTDRQTIKLPLTLDPPSHETSPEASPAGQDSGLPWALSDPCTHSHLGGPARATCSRRSPRGRRDTA